MSVYLFSHILLQAVPKGGQYGSLIMMGALFVVLYFFMIRPQQKKQKDQKTYLSSLKKGDDVITIGGLHGRIVAMDDLTVTLEVDRALKLVFDRSAISMEATKRASTTAAEKAS